ncbi:shikimate dehydrogenase [Lentilactobacillus sp. SPB1-3]|uniref:Shikimate dehydrogenase n=1 Tax=Lentilactobacillus terminaliae TaxID=3003483 RepID=A0ACD5DE33_9LACO|nr:shikimate dehydrogenase [Lentilactobacillus sp. SPB1-3]MCZ0977779.1 shikimate dehydrogenase [Lentilactobacillus sp. SPB1-3]
MNDANTKLYGLLAHPAHHSMSPLIHNTAFAQLKINATYLAFDVDQPKVQPILESMKLMEIGGVNLSMPFKGTVVPYLDSLSESAKKLEAVNTIVNDDGRLRGYNTDGQGFLGALTNQGISMTDKQVIVLGAGGAARAIILASVKSGAREVIVIKRDNATFQATKHELESWSKRVKVISFAEHDVLINLMQTADILVNGTNVGMAGNDELPLQKSELAELHSGQVVFDAIYFPLTTPLLRIAKQQGCVAMNGTGMLVFQAAAAFKLWTGTDMPVDVVMKAVNDEILRRSK